MLAAVSRILRSNPRSDESSRFTRDNCQLHTNATSAGGNVYHSHATGCDFQTSRTYESNVAPGVTNEASLNASQRLAPELASANKRRLAMNASSRVVFATPTYSAFIPSVSN